MPFSCKTRFCPSCGKVRYQRECYQVLADAFQATGIVANAPSALVQVREMGLAIVRIAEEQMAFDRRLGAFTVSESKDLSSVKTKNSTVVGGGAGLALSLSK